LRRIIKAINEKSALIVGEGFIGPLMAVILRTTSPGAFEQK
jgi:hypothetical protein